MKKILLLFILLAFCGMGFAQKYLGSKKYIEKNIKKVIKMGANNGTYSYTSGSCDHATIPSPDLKLFFNENKDKYTLVNFEVCPKSYYFNHLKIVRFQFEITNLANLPEDQKKIISQESQKKYGPAKRFYDNMDKLMAKIAVSEGGSFKSAQWGLYPVYTGYTESTYINKNDLVGIKMYDLRFPNVNDSWMPKAIFFKYMRENGYFVTAAKHNTTDHICAFKFQKYSVINVFLKEKELEQQKREEQKKRESEQKRIQAEKERNDMLAANEHKYKQEVLDAKNRANSKTGWSVIEYTDGYYIGETKNGEKEGFGEYYWKHLIPIEDTWEANISYIGNWSNNLYHGQGKFKSYYKTENVGLWTQVERHYSEIQANFVNGKAEGEGYYSKQTTGFLAGSSTYDYVLYKNGAITRNYSEENRQANRELIKNSDCYKLIEKTTVSYSDGNDVKTTGYKIKCIPPSKYSFEQIIYYNPGGSRYSKGWYRDDGGLLFQDGGLGANKDDTFEQAAKKSCGCY